MFGFSTTNSIARHNNFTPKDFTKKKLGENKAFQASDHTLNFPAIDFSLKWDVIVPAKIVVISSLSSRKKICVKFLKEV